MPWKKTKSGWEQSKKGKLTLGGIPKEVNARTSKRIADYFRWLEMTPLQRAKEIEKREQSK